MADNTKVVKPESEQKRVEISLVIPDNISALYSDLVVITSNEFGFILDFAQSIGNQNQKKVVARIGMSKDHAIALLNALNERLKNALKISSQKN